MCRTFRRESQTTLLITMPRTLYGPLVVRRTLSTVNKDNHHTEGTNDHSEGPRTFGCPHVRKGASSLLVKPTNIPNHTHSPTKFVGEVLTGEPMLSSLSLPSYTFHLSLVPPSLWGSMFLGGPVRRSGSKGPCPLSRTRTHSLTPRTIFSQEIGH